MNEDVHIANDLRRQMSTIRANLGGEVSGLISNAQQLTDWRHYVRSFPWGSLAVATAIGYFAVPRKLEISSPDPETLEKLAKDHRLVVQHTPKGEEKRGVMSSVANVAGNAILRAALAYAGQQVR